MATSVEAIGNADLKNASRAERDELAAPGPPEVESVVPSNGSIEASGTESKGKGGKRSKRKG